MCARIVVSVRTSWNVCKSLRTLYTHAHARIAAHQFLQLGRRCVSVCVVATAARKRHQCIGGRELVFSKFIAEWHTYILDGFFFLAAGAAAATLSDCRWCWWCWCCCCGGRFLNKWQKMVYFSYFGFSECLHVCVKRCLLLVSLANRGDEPNECMRERRTDRTRVF